MCANIVNKEEYDFTDCGYRQMLLIRSDFQRSIQFLHLRVKHVQIISLFYKQNAMKTLIKHNRT